jgi:muramoyltetrapeptide carboxypeptidase
MKQPPFLKPEQTIGITCPAGYMAAEKAADCIQTLQKWGYEVMVGKTLGSTSNNYFSGTDEERRDELQAMLDDPNIHAIIFGRGGYGMGRIINQLDFKKFKKNPKWLVGFSDITVLHNHLQANNRVCSIHGPMAAAFTLTEGDSRAIDSLHQVLKGKRNTYRCSPSPYNRIGKSTGRLVGGNLTLMVNSIGTAQQINSRNKILFLEEIGEQLYHIDRMFYQLKGSGLLNNLAGLVIGGFTDVKDTERPFGEEVESLIRKIVDEYKYPVCFHFPVSHGKENVALKIGAVYQLSVSNKQTVLKEIADIT